MAAANPHPAKARIRRSRVPGWLSRRMFGRAPALTHERAIERLSTPERQGIEAELLRSLREVGLEQLSMQAATAGSFDTLVGGILAGAGALAAVDVALHARHSPLIAAGFCALFGMVAALRRRPQNGPTIPEMLAMRRVADVSGKQYALEDNEVEWLVVGDIARTVDNNAGVLRWRAVWIGAAIFSLLFGLGALARDEYVAAKEPSRKMSGTAKRTPTPPPAHYNGHIMYVIGDDGNLVRDSDGNPVRVAPSEVKLRQLTPDEERYLQDTDDRALIFGSLPVPGPTMPAPVRRLFGFGRRDLIQPGAPVQMGQAPAPTRD